MQRMNIPFSPPDISETEIQEVAEALRSGWITTGPRTKKLEREIGKENAAVSLDHVSHSPCVTPAKALRVLGVKHKHGILDIYKEYYNGAYLR